MTIVNGFFSCHQVFKYSPNIRHSLHKIIMESDCKIYAYKEKLFVAFTTRFAMPT